MVLGLKAQDNCFLYSINYVMLDFLAFCLIPECSPPSKSWNLFIQMNVSDVCYFFSISEPFPALPHCAGNSFIALLLQLTIIFLNLKFHKLMCEDSGLQGRIWLLLVECWSLLYWTPIVVGNFIFIILIWGYYLGMIFTDKIAFGPTASGTILSSITY